MTTEDVDLCLILGGSERREKASLKACKKHFDGCPIWISGSGCSKVDLFETMAEIEIDVDLVRLDYKAIDTLSNITSLVADIVKGKFEKVAVITSSYHARRVKKIASIVFNKFKINFQQVNITYKGDPKKESMLKVWRDQFRAYIWVLLKFDIYPFVYKVLQAKQYQALVKKIKTETYQGKYSLLLEDKKD